MPCIPLVITSACFLIPSVIGILKKRKKDVIATSLLACTSIWFHSSGTLAAYIVDKTYAHIIGITYCAKSILYCARYRRVCDVAILALACGTVVCYVLEGDTLNVALHSMVHMTSIVAFSLHMVTDNATKSIV